MSRPYDYPGGFLLTKKKAEALAVQEFGTARGLEQESGMGKGFFLMRIGKLKVRIMPDVVFDSGRIKMKIDMRDASDSLCKFFDRDTLEEDFDLAQRFRRRRERENLRDWVDNSGAEWCHGEIDRIAERRS